MTAQLIPGVRGAVDLSSLTKRIADLEAGRNNESAINNGGFEEWAANDAVSWSQFWKGGSPTITKDESVFYRGARSVRVNFGAINELQRLDGDEFRVSPMDFVTMKCAYRGSSTTQLLFEMNLITNEGGFPPTFFAGGSASVQTSAQWFAPVANTWFEQSCTFIVPANHTRAKMFLTVQSLASGGGTQAWWDAASARVTSQQLIANESDTGWVTPSLVGGFSQYGAPWGTTPPVGFRRKNGIVFGQGLIIGPLNTTAFTLPVGFRPNRNLIRSAVAGDVASEIRIGGDGSVQWTTGNPASWASLGDLGPFPADA